MSELKELFLNPIYFGLIVVTFVIYTSFLLKYGNTKGVAAKLEKAWIIVFLLALLGVKYFPFTKLNPSALSDVDKTPGSAIAQLGIYVYITLILNSRFRYFFRSTASIFKNPFLGSLLTLTFLSALWSATPDVTLKSSIVLLGTAAFAAHVSNQYSWQELASLLRWSSTCIGLASIPIALLMPSIGTNTSKGGWQGVLPHPNPLGALMALNAVLWYLHTLDKPQHRWISLSLAVLSFTVMILSNSAGAISIFMVMISLLVLLRFLKRLRFSQAFISVILFTIVGTTATILIVENMQSILNAFGKNITFTGRTEFWPKVVEAIMQRPFLGHGYKGFWQPWQGTNNPAAFIKTDEGWVAPHSHNGFLDLAIDLGFIGLILFFLSFLQNVAQGVLYLSRSRLSESPLPLILLMFLVMKNVSETGLWDTDLDLFLYVLITVRLSIDTLGKGYSGNQRSRLPTLLSSKRSLNAES